MNNKLYYIAYKFLKIRATVGNPMTALESLNYSETQTVIEFLKYNHHVKFI